MKSSYIWRTFSSTTVLLVSFFSSSQASQNIMFSSLNSVLRNCLKQPRPAALFITLSKDTVQERASSRVGFGLQNKRFLVILFSHSLLYIWSNLGFSWKAPCVIYSIFTLPFFTVGCSLCSVFKSGSLNCLILTPNSQTVSKNTERKNTKRVLFSSQAFFLFLFLITCQLGLRQNI